jgi:transcription-repair coupling factor (superfamily II helicase)
VEMRIPPAYVPETHQRLSIYKRVSQVRSQSEVSPLREELRDRYGPPPPEVDGLLRFAQLRVRAEALAVLQVDAAPGALILRFDSRTPLEAEALVGVARERPGSALLPDGLRWPLDGAEPMDALAGLLDRLQEAL